MEFKLFYKGKLASNDDPAGKNKIRRCFHKQLAELWKLPPLSNHLPEWLGSDSKLNHSVNRKKFVFLVAKSLNMYAELSIQVLMPQKSISFKDIDNKLKTLFDALHAPRNATELPQNWRPNKTERPLFCLLEDDELIYKIDVDTEYLLAADYFKVNRKETLWIINVKIKGNCFDKEYMDLIV